MIWISVAIFLGCLLYIIIPYMFSYSKRVRNFALFANVLNFPNPRYSPIKEPHHFGIINGENHTIFIDHANKINLWHVTAGSSRGNSVIIYCHGNSSNRAMDHRVALYKVLQQKGFDIITFDYRGYGDSEGVSPNEETVVEDARTVLDWTRRLYANKKIAFWGHSLGSGISIKLLKSVQNYEGYITALVLESPFLNSKEAGKHFPLSKIFDIIPFTRGVIGDSFDGMFPSDKFIWSISVPICILHAEDDIILPLHHATKLKDICDEKGKTNVDLRIFTHGGHKFLCKNEDAMEAAGMFLERYL